MRTVKKITTALLVLFLGISLHAEQIKLQMSTPYPVLESGRKNTAYIKVSLTGFEMSAVKRPPVNVAIVLDKSGSMSGAKIREAKAAAINAVNRLQKDDIISVIAYDNGVKILIPSTKLTDKESVIENIKSINANGGTALFAGVSKGGAEVRKFLNKEAVNRIVLLSDGQANQGPSSPAELGELGSSLIKEGISVSTIGLGKDYNEDLMVRLATKSDGNHIFAESAEQLATAFKREFGDVLSVVAQEVIVRVNCNPGVRPVKVLGRDAEIQGQKVLISMNQLYSKQEKFIILEVEVPAGENKTSQKLADANVSYSNMQTKVTDKLSSELSVRFSNDKGLVDESLDKESMVSVVSLEATMRNSLAMKLRDQGKVEEAQKILILNCNILNEKFLIIPSSKLKEQWNWNKNDLDNIVEPSKYQVQRKRMTEANKSNVDQSAPLSYDQVEQEQPHELEQKNKQKHKSK